MVIDCMVKRLYPNIEWELLTPSDMEEIYGTDNLEVCLRASELLNRTTIASWPSQEQIMFDFIMAYLGAPLTVITGLFMIWAVLFG